MRAVSIAVGAMFVVLLAGVAPASAQWRAERRDDRRDDRRVNVERIINQVENRSDAFRRSVDRALDRSRLNGSRQEDRLNEEVKQFEKEFLELMRGSHSEVLSNLRAGKFEDADVATIKKVATDLAARYA